MNIHRCFVSDLNNQSLSQHIFNKESFDILVESELSALRISLPLDPEEATSQLQSAIDFVGGTAGWAGAAL